MIRNIQRLGILVFLTGFVFLLLSLREERFTLTQQVVELTINRQHHKELINAVDYQMLDAQFESRAAFVKGLEKVFRDARVVAEMNVSKGLPPGISKEEYLLSDYDVKKYIFDLTLRSQIGGIIVDVNWWLWMTLGLMLAGALLNILPAAFSGVSGSNNGVFHRSVQSRGLAGIFIACFLIAFYVLLYWFPLYITNWIHLADPLSRSLSGNNADQWFLYGTVYTLAVVVMGIRMLVKYRHDRYQVFRTLSVMFFQTAFAFLIPQILVSLNKPYFDFKDMWPLKYDFFFDWNLKSLLSNGTLGIFMLVWGILLFAVAVPVFTYLFGKRWYCSWVCGCGALAETAGDPFRQLSSKKLIAWRIERYLIYIVLVLVVVMTCLVLYTYFTGSAGIGPLNSYQIRQWYGFGIGSVFAGVVGVGFYPLMGNRVWCRFGCPLAAYMGIIQRFKSRFRITVNGNQCISCGNCSSYCEMGIDVRAYAQNGQDVVRASCVGCGICVAVCPRGVLKLENAAADVSTRAQNKRNIFPDLNDTDLTATKTD